MTRPCNQLGIIFVYFSSRVLRITITRKIFVFLTLIFLAKGLISSHLVGGFLTYRWLGSNGTTTQYRVTLFVYRDCTNDGTDGEVPFDETIDLCVYSGDKRLYTTYVVRLISRKKVQPVGNTNCPEVASACLEQGIYEVTIGLPNSSTGYHLKWERCCRNTQNNLRDQTGEAYQGQTYYGFIPPSSIKNSSPYFQDIPVPFICKNDTTTIRNRAVDPDGDSLSYRFVTPWQGAQKNDPVLNTCPDPMSNFPEVDYRNGYSATNPFGTSGIASIDAFNGLTTYMSKINGRFAVAIEVTEWRNGVAISTVRLDLQILVINCAPNNKPDLRYETGSRIWEIQPGEKKCWKVTAFDDVDDDQIITLKAYGDILTGSTTYTGTKATLSPATNANKGSVTSEFCWQPDCDVNTQDTFRVTFEAYDDGCPSKFINENVLIKVKPFDPQEILKGPFRLCQNDTGEYTLVNRDYSNKIKWKAVRGKIIGSDTSNTVKVQWGTFATGSLIYTVTNSFGCESEPINTTIKLVPAPDKPDITGADTICLGTQYSYKYEINNFNAGLAYSWSWNNAIPRANPADNSYQEVSWVISNTNPAWISVIAQNTDGCRSIPDSLFVIPASTGEPIISGPTTICPNNTGIAYYIDNFDANSTYTWDIIGATGFKEIKNGEIEVDWGNQGAGQIEVTATNRFGCKYTSKLLVQKTYNLLGQPPIGDTAFCEFTTGVPYKVNQIKGETYEWSVSGGSIGSGQNTDNITVDWGVAGLASVGVTSKAYDPVNQKECSSQEFQLPVRLYPIPSGEIFDLDKESEQCQNQGDIQRLTTSLQGKLNNGDSLFIETSGGLNVWVSDRDPQTLTPLALDYSLNQFGTFTVRARIVSDFGCPGPWDEVEVTINPKPVNTVVTGDSIFCFPAATDYNYVVNGEINSRYVWNLTGGVFTVDPGTSNQARISWDTNAINRSLKVLEISDKGCPGDTIGFGVFYDNPNIYLKLVTVTAPPAKDDAIEVHYTVGNSPIPNGSTHIQRRINGSSLWSTVGTSPQNNNLYTDASANPDANPFDYRVFMLNRCGDTLFSNEHTSVLLTGEKTGPLSVSFTFTPYQGFENGVERYELHRQLVGKGGFQLYQTYPMETTDSFKNGEDNYGQRYRIKAYELGGDRVSWSNDFTLYFEPVMFIPNAFTPNGKGPNDVFRPVISGVKDYRFIIYSRWGEKIAEFNDESQGWDGNYGDKPAQEGVYVYRLEFKDFQDKLYQFSGTIHLIR